MSDAWPPGARDELVRRLAARARPMAPMPTEAEPRQPALPGIRAVLFDVYGTLLISGTGDIGLAEEAARGPAMAGAFRAAGFPGVTDARGARAAGRFMELIREAHRERRAAGGEYPEVDIRDIWRDLVREAAAQGGLAAPAHALAIPRLAVEYESRVNPVWPMPGFEETLTALRAQGLALGIVSNAQFYTPLTFEALTGRDPEGWGFDPELCIWSFEHRRAKPDPWLFEQALRRLDREYGIAPPGTLVVGNDRLNDIAPAARLGCRTALFAGDRRSYRPRLGDPRCAGIEPDLVVAGLAPIAAGLDR
ncbi:MAG: HAD family hydrolase [Kiritimatiellae bacterium]|nr:HAD family hydrolase [Kiritimatiellia bacterium]